MIIAPTVHDNGTSAERLQFQRSGMIDALNNALAELRQMAPNPRDYPLGIFEQAQAQHQRRDAALRGLLAEVEAESTAIFAQTGISE